MEGNVFRCKWQKRNASFQMWMESDPSVSVVADDFEHGSEELAELIANKTGDGEAVLEFVPPPPTSGTLKQWTTPLVLLLGYNESTEIANDRADLYLSGVCNKCGVGLGGRGANKLVLKKTLKSDVAAAVGVLPRIRLVSEDFLKLFSPEELSVLTVRETHSLVPAKKRYYEVLGGVIIPRVSFKGAKLDPITCRICSVCGSRRLNPVHRHFRLNAFIPRAEILRTDIPDVFLIGSESEGLDLCVKGSRWAQTQDRAGTKGAITSQIGLVDAADVEESPNLPNR